MMMYLSPLQNAIATKYIFAQPEIRQVRANVSLFRYTIRYVVSILFPHITIYQNQNFKAIQTLLKLVKNCYFRDWDGLI
jgi:hypothetical protein